MATFSPTETAQINANSTSDQYASFDSGVQQLYLTTSADVYIDFDTPAVTSRSLLLKANLQPVLFDLHGSNIRKLFARTGSSTAIVYVLAVRN
jgi:hypothetical protein